MLYAYVLPKLPIVMYYRRKAASQGSKTVSADLAAAGIQNQSDLVTSDFSRSSLCCQESIFLNFVFYFYKILHH